MAKLSKAKLRQLDAMSPSDRAFALFTAVEKARSAALNEIWAKRHEIDEKAYDEAHFAALAVWNQWALPLLAKRTAIEKTGMWSVKYEYSAEFSVYIEVGQNPETQDYLRHAELNAGSIIFIEVDWAEEKKIEEEKSISNSSEPPSRTILCETIKLDGFSFPGCASFISTIFKGDTSFYNTTFKGYTPFNSATFKGDTSFETTVFKDNVLFNRATFEGDASFCNANFKCGAYFVNTAFKGDADFFGTTFKDKTYFFSATVQGEAHFYDTNFIGDSSFGGAIFKNYTSFSKAAFKGDADFELASFKDDADFELASFKRETYFNRASFNGNASFNRATFIGVASFSSLSFKGNADFRQVDFLSHANFSQTIFLLESNWTAINALRAFNMAGARFETQVPQFTQSHFTESPRVDNVTLPMPSPGHSTLPAPKPEAGWNTKQVHSWGWVGGATKDERVSMRSIQAKWEELEDDETLGDAPEGETLREIAKDGKRYRYRERERKTPKPKPGKPIDKDDIAAFTALRRIAKQGEDHETERKAFKGEMRTQRIAGDHRWPYRLFSWAYDLFTDFGGSFMRPLGWWFLTFSASVFIYLIPATSPINKTEQATCSHPLTRASLLSARNALLFATAGQRPFVTKSLDCLYGKEPKEEAIQHPTRTGPPQWLGLFGTAQTLLSAILIFFILLALRNRFKI